MLFYEDEPHRITYHHEHLIAVHGDMLFYEDEPHWRLNPALDPE